MAKLTWGDAGTRLYETGVDRGVLYVDGQPGVAWNGLVSVSEAPTGGEARPYYLDGYKYLNVSALEEFAATINAFSAPAEFDECDGTTAIHNGLFATQQKRKAFGLTYRTLIGNDTQDSDHGYKIHLVYNALAAPSTRDRSTIGATTSPMSLSWGITTTPKHFAGAKPTAHLVIDSTKSNKLVLAYLEAVLYGANGFEPMLPTPEQMIDLFNWTPDDLGYAINILGEADSASETVTNYVTNPSFEATSGDVEIYRNLAPNPSFEDGDSYPSSVTMSSTMTASFTTNSPVHGSRAMRLTTTTTGSLSIPVSNILPETGVVHTLVMWLRPIGKSWTIYPRIRANRGEPIVIPADVWTEIRYTAEAGSGNSIQTGAEVFSSNGHAIGDQIDVDSVVIVEGVYAGSYFDGDTIAGAFLPGGKMVLGWASHDLNTLAAEEQAFGTRSGVISTYSDFVNQPQFPVEYAQAAVDRSSALLVAWEPWDWNAPIGQQPTFAPRVVAGGAHDGHITNWLSEAQSWTSKIPVWVRFAPEMNDTARPWAVGIGTSGYAEATPAEYIAMWRHVYAIKQLVAPDVQMMWNPLNFGAGAHPFEAFYPGDDYVDLLALNGFNWGDVQGTAGWQDSTSVFGFNDPVDGPVPRLKALANGKPWGLAEVASAPDNPADFQPGGKFYGSYGSWVFDWPENPPYEAVADDWITQHGFTEMMIRRAADEGASFVALFHTIKETDWRLTDTAEGRAVMSKVLAWSPDVIDRLPVAGDPDLTASWVGTPNASASVLTGLGVAGFVSTGGHAVQSHHHLGTGGSPSVRLIPTGAGLSGVFATFSVTASSVTGMGTVSLDAPLQGTLDDFALTLAMSSSDGPVAVAAPNLAGDHPLRVMGGEPVGGDASITLTNGAARGNGDVWWTDVGLFTGDYDGPWFDGDTPGIYRSQMGLTEWSGTPHASASQLKTYDALDYQGSLGDAYIIEGNLWVFSHRGYWESFGAVPTI